MAQFKDVVEIASKILLPLVIFLVGFFFNIVQYQNNKDKAAVDRNSKLMEQLTSNDPSKKKAAILILDYLVKEEEVPANLVASALVVASQDSSISGLASNLFENIAKKGGNLKKAITEAAAADTAIGEYLAKTDFDKDLNKRWNAASIASSEDFLTCRDIDNKLPFGITDQFQPGKVVVWLRIRTPLAQERLQLDWVNLDKESIIDSSYPYARRNMAGGYRTWAAKTIREPGRYAVTLFNSLNQELGRREFTIVDRAAKTDSTAAK